MRNVLVPVNGSKDAQWAVSRVIEMYREEPVRIHLLDVQPPLSQHVTRFIGGNEVRRFHEEEGLRELQPAMDMLNGAGIPFQYHVKVGRRAETIVSFAADKRCSQIVMGEQQTGFLSHFGLGSVANQVRHLIGGASIGCEVI